MRGGAVALIQRSLRAAAFGILVAYAPSAGGQAVLPPRRPPQDSGPGALLVPEPAPPPAASPTPSPNPANAVSAPQPPLCLPGLAAAGIEAEPAPLPAAPQPGCAIEEPVRLVSLALGAGSRIGLPDRPLVACRYARPFAEWAVRIAAPILRAAHGSPLAAIRTGPGYECRGRNRQPDAKLSAHAQGLALDVAGFEFADRPSLPVKPSETAPATDEAALAAIRRAACGWFTTILGPGSDPFHADHLHLDIQIHGASDRYRICQ